jgi:hypothetical protein
MPLRIFGNMSAPANTGNWASIASLLPSGANATANDLNFAHDGAIYLEVQATVLLRYGTANAAMSGVTGGSDFAEMTLLTGRVYMFDELRPDRAWVRSSTTSAATFSVWSA